MAEFLIIVNIFIFYFEFQFTNEITIVSLSFIFDIILIASLIYKRYLFKIRYFFLGPIGLFFVVFEVSYILGKVVWFLRELYWFNESGNPSNTIFIFQLVSLILWVVCIFNLNLIRHQSKNLSTLPIVDWIITPNKMGIIWLLALFGAFLFTGGFAYIPIFSSEMSETRYSLQNAGASNRQLGLILLLGAIYPSIYILNVLVKEKVTVKNIFLLILFYIPFLLYSSRFLLVIPLMIYGIYYVLLKNKFNLWIISVSILLILAGYGGLMYFMAVRNLGSVFTWDLAIRLLWADSFPEYRLFTHIYGIMEHNVSEVVYGTFFSGLIPGKLLTLINLDKNMFFIPIGGFFQSKMPHLGINLGIRISLIGELYMAGGWYSLIPSFTIILLYLTYINTRFFKFLGNNNLFVIYYLITGLFFSLSNFYGTLFLITTVHFTLFSYVFIQTKILSPKIRST